MVHVHRGWRVFELQGHVKQDLPVFVSLGLLLGALVLVSIARTWLILHLSLVYVWNGFLGTVARFGSALGWMAKVGCVIWLKQVWSLGCWLVLLAIHEGAHLVHLLRALMLLFGSYLGIDWGLHLQLRVNLSVWLIKKLLSLLMTMMIVLSLIWLQVRVDLILVLLHWAACLCTLFAEQARV